MFKPYPIPNKAFTQEMQEAGIIKPARWIANLSGQRFLRVCACSYSAPQDFDSTRFRPKPITVFVASVSICKHPDGQPFPAADREIDMVRDKLFPKRKLAEDNKKLQKIMGGYPFCRPHIRYLFEVL